LTKRNMAPGNSSQPSFRLRSGLLYGQVFAEWWLALATNTHKTP